MTLEEDEDKFIPMCGKLALVPSTERLATLKEFISGISNKNLSGKYG